MTNPQTNIFLNYVPPLRQLRLLLFCCLVGLGACGVSVDLDVNGRTLLGDGMPNSIRSIGEMIPAAQIDVRYYSEDNFVGSRIDGYNAEKLFITEEAGLALARVQERLAAFGLGLKIFDAYRPQRAVDHFVRWAEDLSDTRMKQQYYPEVSKSVLFEQGYIAARSGHSRGSTVALTLVVLADGSELDMGSGWDFFDPISWPSSTAVSPQQRANRMLLRTLMVDEGFIPLAEEWWHFTLEDEPYADSYFDFPVQ